MSPSPVPPPAPTVDTVEASTPGIEPDTGQPDDADLLVEDVSIDGMCGVY
jgi:mycofactocin precursor